MPATSSRKKIGIVGASDGWHVLDLCRAAQELRIFPAIFDFRHISAGIGMQWGELSRCDAVIVRTMPLGSLEQVIFRMDILGRIEAQGIPILNPPRPLEICIDKYLAAARLEAAGLPVPKTIVCQTSEEALEAFEALGRDVILKPLFGSEGRGMIRISDLDIAWRTFKAMERIQSVLYIQKFIAHPGWDLRIFILDGEIITAMQRVGKDSWRTNVAQGGSGKKFRVKDFQAELALNAAKATEVIVSGVDLLPGPDGEWYVLEVNAVPGWRALQKVTRVDIAAKIIQHVTKNYA